MKRQSLATLAFIGLGLVIYASPALSRPPANDTCIQGYVWREAFKGDHVCVTPETRRQAAIDNRKAKSRYKRGGGAYGPQTCIKGYVWREANRNDRVCVTPATRKQTAIDNQMASKRVVRSNRVTQPQPRVQVRPGQVRPRVPVRPRTRPVPQRTQRACPDPAIVNFRAAGISRNRNGTYNFTLMAWVKNLGTSDYITGSTEQAVILEKDDGRRPMPVLMRRPFGNLILHRPGLPITLQVRNWSAAPSNEFPANFILSISYDPDIYIDGNPKNDDCRLNNNEKTLTGQQINETIRRSGR